MSKRHEQYINDYTPTDISTTQDIIDLKEYQRLIRSEDFYNAKRLAIASSGKIITAEAINELIRKLQLCQNILFERGLDWLLYDADMNPKANENDYTLR